MTGPPRKPKRCRHKKKNPGNGRSWDTVLKAWRSGTFRLEYPPGSISFFWRTNDANSAVYREQFENSPQLPRVQDYTPFASYLIGKKEAYAFRDLSGETMLVVPAPKRNKNFATLKDFTDNGSLTQQGQFWQLVARVVSKMRQIYPHVYVSVHGLGVSYLHVRVSHRVQNTIVCL